MPKNFDRIKGFIETAEYALKQAYLHLPSDEMEFIDRARVLWRDTEDLKLDILKEEILSTCGRTAVLDDNQRIQ